MTAVIAISALYGAAALVALGCRLRTFWRGWWYTLTGRMPRYKGRPEPDHALTFAEHKAISAIVAAERDRAIRAAIHPDPSRRWL